MHDKLIENIMEGYYQAHPQGEELLKLDLAEYKRLLLDEVVSKIGWHIDELHQLKENSKETPVNKTLKELK